MKALRVTATLLFVLASTATLALVEGGTNLPAPGYPEHRCALPSPRPDKPFRGDEYIVKAYNSEVERYNRQLTEFRDCMATYVDNANNDIKRIQEAANKAMIEFRSHAAGN